MPPARTAYGRLPEWPKGAVCKTVGSAYVGSNPTPATPWRNGPLAVDSRLCGPFLPCPVMCHLVPPWTAVSRRPRTYSGRRPAARTVGAHRWPSADGHGRAVPVAGSGLTCGVESSVHSRLRRPCLGRRSSVWRRKWSFCSVSAGRRVLPMEGRGPARLCEPVRNVSPAANEREQGRPGRQVADSAVAWPGARGPACGGRPLTGPGS